MREIQALDPTVDPDQAIRTPCAPAAPAVPKAPAAPATPAAAQALKLTDAAARLGEALCGVPTERNPSTPHTRGCTPGWYAVPRWGTHSSAKAYRRGGVSWRGPMRRSYRTQSFHPPYPGLYPGLVCRAPLGHPLESSLALCRPVEATPMNYQRPYLGSLRHCSLLPGDRLCVRGGQVLATGCWEGQAAGRAPNVLGTGCWE